jgi:hypothetical protein
MRSVASPADVQVRVCGDLPGIASALRDAAEIEGFEFSGMTRPYPNRQAIRRPAAPSRRHLP